MSSLLQTAALLGSLATSASAHGLVQGIVAGGKWYQGYDPSFQYADPAPVVIGWSVPEDLGRGFIGPDNYTTSDIICHLDATPGGTSAKVAAGSVVELQWTDWPDSHHGPVLDYLAKCPGKCENVDKTQLEFFKIDEVGLINDDPVPGTWATDQLIANNQSWVVTIPKSIAPGNYVLRHEIIALHSAGEAGGAQNYPQCINLQITGSGTETPAGESATKFYKESDPGILVNIYTALTSYKIPGPKLIADAVSMKQTQIPINGAAPTSVGKSTVYGATSTIASSTSAALPVSSSAAAQSGAASYSAPAASSSAALVSSAPAAYSSAAGSSSAGAVSSSSAAPPAYGGASSSAGAVSSSAVAPSSYGAASNSAGAASSSAAVSSFAAASSSLAPPISVSSSTCTKQTVTITKTKPHPASSAAPASSSAASYPAASSTVITDTTTFTTHCTKTRTYTSSGQEKTTTYETTSTVTSTIESTITVYPSSSASVPASSAAPASSSAPISSAVPASYPTPASSGAAASETAPWSCLSNIAAAIPTGYLTQTAPPLPTGTGAAYPTGGAYGAYPTSGYSSGSGPAPHKAAPEGYTVKDLLDWFTYTMKNVFSSEGKHGRDFQQR